MNYKKYFIIGIFLLLNTFKIAAQNGNLNINNQWILEGYFKKDSLQYLQNKKNYIIINKNKFTGITCFNNKIKGEIKIKKTKIKFYNISSGKIKCNCNNVENDFINKLSIINHYEIIGGEMILYQNKNKLMALESFKD